MDLQLDKRTYYKSEQLKIGDQIEHLFTKGIF